MIMIMMFVVPKGCDVSTGRCGRHLVQTSQVQVYSPLGCEA